MILPSTVVPSGICTVTGAPSTASDCLVASRATVTTRFVEVVWRIACALAALPDVLVAPEEPDPPAPAVLVAAALPEDFEVPPAAPAPLEREPVLPAAPVPLVPDVARSFASSAVSAFSSASSAAIVVG